MDVSTSDDPMQNISVGNLGEMQAASDNSVGPGPGLPMVIVGSDSDSDHDPYTDDSRGPLATFIVPQFNEESPTNIPTRVIMSDSDSGEDNNEDSHQQSGSVITARSGFGRNPVTGTYTAASFAHFQDEWL